MKLSHHENLLGGVYMHLLRSPNGPSLTFRVTEYCLAKDVFNLVHKMFDNRQFSKPPLLAMTGFSGPMSANGVKEPPPPHARLVVDMFQNMLPSLNVQKVRYCVLSCACMYNSSDRRTQASMNAGKIPIHTCRDG